MSGKPGWEKRSMPRAEASPTYASLCWAAGFLEGEGCFRKSQARAAQKYEEPLLHLQTMFGGQIRQSHKTKHYTWTACGARGRGVMMTLYALLSTRRQAQIRSAL